MNYKEENEYIEKNLKEIIYSPEFEYLNKDGAWQRAKEIGELKYIKGKSQKHLKERFGVSDSTIYYSLRRVKILVNTWESLKVQCKSRMNTL